jgi:hypothetical protein
MMRVHKVIKSRFSNNAYKTASAKQAKIMIPEINAKDFVDLFFGIKIPPVDILCLFK